MRRDHREIVLKDWGIYPIGDFTKRILFRCLAHTENSQLTKNNSRLVLIITIFIRIDCAVCTPLIAVWHDRTEGEPKSEIHKKYETKTLLATRLLFLVPIRI